KPEFRNGSSISSIVLSKENNPSLLDCTAQVEKFSRSSYISISFCSVILILNKLGTFIILFVGKEIKTAAIVPGIIIKIAAGLIKADIETPLITIPTPTATIPSIKPITEVLSMLNPPKIKQGYYSFFKSTHLLLISVNNSVV